MAFLSKDNKLHRTPATQNERRVNGVTPGKCAYCWRRSGPSTSDASAAAMAGILVRAANSVE